MADKNQQSPVHWSKDFVEHLRTVHFGLIAVSAGLILLVFSSKQYNSVNALVQIEEIIELKKQWSPAWIVEYADKKVHTPSNPDLKPYEPVEQNPHKDPSVPFKVLSTGFTGMTLWYPFVPAGGHHSPMDAEVPTPQRFTFPRDNWVQKPDTDPNWSPTSFPRTLTEFEAWWNALTQEHHIYIPDEIWPSGKLINSSHKRGLPRFIFGEISSDGDVTQSNLLRLSSDDESNTFFYSTTLKDGEILIFPITQVGSYEVNQASVARQFDTHQTGDFGRAFKDLSLASGNFKGLELADIKELIHDDAEKGPEVFEAFGMKFPAAQVTLSGIALLLSVQLYFITYLKQLRGKLGREDAGWDVPWIGMNPNKDAQTIFFITVMPLPFGAIAFLVIRQIAALVPQTSDLYTKAIVQMLMLHWFQFAFLLAACCAGLFLAVLSWKYRPVMTAQKTEDNPEALSGSV